MKSWILIMVLGCYVHSSQAGCLSEEEYSKLPSTWQQINPQGKVLSDRTWPPRGKYALFYFPEPRVMHGTGELTRFRIGYVTNCDARGGPGGVMMMNPPFSQASIEEPTHWLPLTHVAK